MDYSTVDLEGCLRALPKAAARVRRNGRGLRTITTAVRHEPELQSEVNRTNNWGLCILTCNPEPFSFHLYELSSGATK